MQAAGSGHVDCAEVLLANGADPTAVGACYDPEEVKWRSPIEIAGWKGKITVVDLLSNWDRREKEEILRSELISPTRSILIKIKKDQADLLRRYLDQNVDLDVNYRITKEGGESTISLFLYNTHFSCSSLTCQ